MGASNDVQEVAYPWGKSWGGGVAGWEVGSSCTCSEGDMELGRGGSLEAFLFLEAREQVRKKKGKEYWLGLCGFLDKRTKMHFCFV